MSTGMAYLVITPKGKDPYKVKLDGGAVAAVVVGRAVGSDVWIHDGVMSRQHCRIFRDAGQWWVEDLGSTNGTYLAGHRLKSKHPLKDGETIELGDSRVTFYAG